MLWAFFSFLPSVVHASFLLSGAHTSVPPAQTPTPHGLPRAENVSSVWPLQSLSLPSQRVSEASKSAP